ncbi:hypothetical protein L1887_34904 [Cichorium endivia]|nr:hypothetical protein L1887_34904 [Cichorium endivia]
MYIFKCCPNHLAGLCRSTKFECIWYGPDSYMGANIVELFHQMTLMADEEISKIHPDHTRNSINHLLLRLHYFQDGTCIVHHLFGHEVVEKINDMYCDAFLTAHFEVPGQMFSLAMEAKRRGMGVETTWIKNKKNL